MLGFSTQWSCSEEAGLGAGLPACLHINQSGSRLRPARQGQGAWHQQINRH